MCVYCEQNIGRYYDGDSIIYKKDRFGLSEITTLVTITGETERPKIMVDLCLEDSFTSIINHVKYIKYCPMCGRKLVKEGDQNN